jgi:hypothetical protein
MAAAMAGEAFGRGGSAFATGVGTEESFHQQAMALVDGALRVAISNLVHGGDEGRERMASAEGTWGQDLDEHLLDFVLVLAVANDREGKEFFEALVPPPVDIEAQWEGLEDEDEDREEGGEKENEMKGEERGGVHASQPGSRVDVNNDEGWRGWDDDREEELEEEMVEQRELEELVGEGDSGQHNGSAYSVVSVRSLKVMLA